MSKRRLVTLLVGVLVLGGLSWWRLRENGPVHAPDGPPPLAPPQSSSEAKDDDPAVISFGGQTMGTTYSVKYLSSTVPRSVAEAAVSGALEEVNATMSTYRPDSAVSVFNGLPANTPMPLPESLLDVLRISTRVSESTSGAFDITVRPLVLAYGFGSHPANDLPSKQDLEKIESAVGMEHLLLNENPGTLEKTRPGVSVDLGGVAKGYGVDQAAQALEKLSVIHYMVEVGGEIRVKGEKAPKSPWVLAIEQPRAESRSLHGTLRLSATGGAIATSGDYRNFREMDGRLVSHTFDPRTKKPTPRRTASVSVVRPTAAEADALATALSVLTPDAALELANEKGWAVYMLVHRKGGGFDAQMSKAFGELDFRRQN